MSTPRGFQRQKERKTLKVLPTCHASTKHGPIGVLNLERFKSAPLFLSKAEGNKRYHMAKLGSTSANKMRSSHDQAVATEKGNFQVAFMSHTWEENSDAKIKLSIATTTSMMTVDTRHICKGFFSFNRNFGSKGFFSI